MQARGLAVRGRYSRCKTGGRPYKYTSLRLDYETLFKQQVMDDFADSYLAGHTPIPCVKCNQTVKFKDLLSMAKELELTVLQRTLCSRELRNGLLFKTGH